MGANLHLKNPRDVAWTRKALTESLVDRAHVQGGEIQRSPKKVWRPSLSIDWYPVPLEWTKDDYPDHRIVYLKLRASISGIQWNMELNTEKLPDGVGINEWDAAATAADGMYLPCMGAVVHLDLYHLPLSQNKAAALEYPYVIDMEPKRREAIEVVSQSGESLEGARGSIGVFKSGTSMSAATISGGLTGGYSPAQADAGGNVGASIGGSTSDQYQEVHTVNREYLQERRALLAFVSRLDHIHHVVVSYHVGANRTMMTIQPRPGVVAASNNFNLAFGARKMVGIQDFLVQVAVPASAKGLQVCAELETGHPSLTDWIYLVQTQASASMYFDGQGQRFYCSGHGRAPLELQNLILGGPINTGRMMPIDDSFLEPLVVYEGPLSPAAAFAQAKDVSERSTVLDGYVAHEVFGTILSAADSPRRFPQPIPLSRTRGYGVELQKYLAGLSDKNNSNLAIDQLGLKPELLEALTKAGVERVSQLFAPEKHGDLAKGALDAARRRVFELYYPRAPKPRGAAAAKPENSPGDCDGESSDEQ